MISDGETVTDVAARFGVARKTVHDWLAKYEAGGLENLSDRSHRPVACPHQMPAVVEVAVAELRRAHPSWGPRRLVFELAKRGVSPVPSESGVYRALVRLSLIDPAARRPRDRKWKRWERGTAMELWQMDGAPHQEGPLTIANALGHEVRNSRGPRRCLNLRHANGAVIGLVTHESNDCAGDRLPLLPLAALNA